MSKGKEAVNKEETAPVKEAQLPVAQDPALPPEIYTDDAGGGFGNVGTDDMAIPFMVILQSGSPQVKRGEAMIPGAKEGDLYNTISNELYDEVTVVPCAFQKAFVEWRPRESGGGFVQQHTDASILAQVKNVDGKDMLPNGNVIVATAYHYVLVIDPETGDWSQAVLSMTSTQLKKSRKWLTNMMSLKMTAPNGKKFTPPMWAHKYKISTVAESNEKGSWSGYFIEKGDMVTDADLYMAAKDFGQAVNIGIVSVKAPPTNTDPSDTEEVPY